MNFLKNSWSYLSSSFTQSETDGNESISEFELSKNAPDETEEGVDVLANKEWRSTHDDNDDDLAEFTDAVDTSEDNNNTDGITQTHASVEISQESNLARNDSSEFQSHSDMNDIEPVQSKFSQSQWADLGTDGVVVNMDLPVRGAPVLEVIGDKPKEGYTSLEASDSDDSGEFIPPPPAAPVTRPTNTDSQLNQIIKNLGGDVDILTLEDENDFLPGEEKFGETLYLTACDQTICPLGHDTIDSLSVTAVEENLNYDGKTSPDSAIASSSKSSICSFDSVKLNAEFAAENDLPPTPLSKLDALNDPLNDTSTFSPSPFTTSLLDTTVKEDTEVRDSELQKIITFSEVDKNEQIFRLEVIAEEGEKAEKDQETTPPCGDSIPRISNDTEVGVTPITESLATENSTENLRPAETTPPCGNVVSQTGDNTPELGVSPITESLAAETTPPCGDVNSQISTNITKAGVPIAESLSSKNPPPVKTKMDDPMDEIPVSRGAYTLDFDNLGDFNPFQSRKAMCNSPDLPSKPFPAPQLVDDAIIDHSEDISQANTASENNHMDLDTGVQTSANLKPGTSAIVEEKPVKLPTQNIKNDQRTVSSIQSKNKREGEATPDQNTSEKAKPALDLEDEPIPIAKGSYSLDFDNLDSMDPFKTSKGLQNSPTKPTPAYTMDLDNMADIDRFKSKKTLSFSPPKSPVKNNVGLLKNMNENADVNVLPEPDKKKTIIVDDSVTKPTSDLINVDAGNLENVDPAPAKKLAKKPVLGGNRKKVTKPKMVKKKAPPPKQPDPAPFGDPDDEIIVTKGSYSFNFDDLDGIDPFKTSKGLCNSPTKNISEPSFTQTPEGEHQPKPLEDSPGKGTSVDPPMLAALSESQVPKMQNASQDLTDQNEASKICNADGASDIQKTKKSPTMKKKTKKPSPIKAPPIIDDVDDADRIPLAKGAYNLDFDNLESMDPFKTSKGLANSPTDEKPPGHAIDPFKPSKQMANSPRSSPTKLEDTAANARNEDSAKRPATKKKIKKPSPIKSPPIEDDVDDADRIPLAKGAYNLDFDNLESMDPFKTSKGLANSPTDEKPPGHAIDPFKPSKQMANSPPASPTKLESTALKAENEDSAKTKKSLATKKKAKKPSPIQSPPIEDDIDDADSIPLAKGAYNLDFDNLESMDPFKTSKGLANSPTDEKPPGHAIDPFKPSKQMANSPPRSPTKLAGTALKAMDEDSAKTKKSPAKKKKIKKPSPIKSPPMEDDVDDADRIPLAKGTYNLDFDNLESMDPFQTSKGLANSPTEKKPPGYSMDPFKPSKQMTNSPPGSPTKLEGTALKATKIDSAKVPTEEGTSESKIEKIPLTSEPIEKEDEAKPLDNKKPKRKQTGLARKKLMKPGIKKPPAPAEDIASDEIPALAKGAYNLDFDNLNAMDPFKSSKGLSNSPMRNSPPPVSGYAANLDDLDAIDPFKPRKSMMNSPPSSPKGFQAEEQPLTLVDTAAKPESDVLPTTSMRELTSVTSVEDIDPAFQTANETADLSLAGVQPETGAAIMEKSELVSTEEQNMDNKQLQQMEFDKVNEDEEFYPASSVFQDPAALAYLDRLGGVKPLTASNLRKQSLYVQFDPLVSDSPLRQIPQRITRDNDAAEGDPSKVVVDHQAQGDHSTNRVSVEEQNKSKEPIAAAETSSVSANVPTVGVDLHTSMDQFNQPYLSQQSFGTAPPTLKYTQADFDTMLRKAELEWEMERNEKTAKEGALRADLEQLTNVVKGYEQLFADMSSNGPRNGMLSREQQLLKAEHEQSLEDLAALERSHEDLCRRYNRLKAVITQFKMNEEILKKSANEMMEEARVAEKKYFTLKIKAEEDVKKANAELQFVQANAQQEVARAQAQLKMLELKCDSMQSQIRDSNKENEELTKLCDDLIACSKRDE